MDRERVYRVEAVILKRQDLGEADRLLTVLSPDRGKLRLVGKGIRKPTSRKAGHLELFTHANLLVARGRNLDIVTQADTIQAFRGLRDDLTRATIAYYVAELVDQFATEDTENRTLFRLLLEMLGELETARRLDVLLRSFELHVLDVAGYRPRLHTCPTCQRTLEPVVNFLSLAEGGVVCPRCSEADRTARPLSLNAFKVLRFLQDQTLAAANRLRLSASVRGELEQALRAVLVYTLERQLKSTAFLDLVQRQDDARRLANPTKGCAPACWMGPAWTY
jgi:DNA repair protein RecO (recombination protein O)